MKNFKPIACRGFTLIELSIVLVIIGLISAGVIIGRDLIYAAQVRMQVAQLESLDAAVNSFRIKYTCLPGDCANGASIGLADPGGVGDGGNGNGYIENAPTSDKIIGPELSGFWEHLSRAQLIGDPIRNDTLFLELVPGINTPSLKLPGRGTRGGPLQANPRGGISLLERIFLTKHINAREYAWIIASRDRGYPGTYLATDIFALESKIDDGRHNTGVIRTINRAIDRPLELPLTTPSEPDSCVNGDGTYNLASTDPTKDFALCSPIFYVKF